MSRPLETWPIDFWANIRLLTPDESGRKTLPHSGIRWNFCFADEYDRRMEREFAIGSAWAIFVNDAGAFTIEPEVGLYDVRTRYCLPFEEYRNKTKAKLKIGTHFFSTEGSHIVAEGVVTEIIDR